MIQYREIGMDYSSTWETCRVSLVARPLPLVARARSLARTRHCVLSDEARTHGWHRIGAEGS
eukprot:155670-Prymnesium_polylepis.2